MVEDIFFNGFNEDNPYVRYFIDLKKETYIFNIRWNKYCKCAFLTIKDFNNNDIINGKALVNGLIIRNNKLPYNFLFNHINEKTYEPTLKNIEKEFVLTYISEDDEV
jgi:hypothetical protein